MKAIWEDRDIVFIEGEKAVWESVMTSLTMCEAFIVFCARPVMRSAALTTLSLKR